MLCVGGGAWEGSEKSEDKNAAAVDWVTNQATGVEQENVPVVRRA